MDIQTITPAEVMQVYSGKPGCMCGCKGKYSVNPAHRAAADKDRGYPHDDEDMKPGQVTRVLRLLQADPRAAYDADGYVHVPNAVRNPGERVLVAYLAPSVRS